MANSPPSYEDFFQAAKDAYMQNGDPNFKPSGDLTLLAQDNNDVGDGCYVAVYGVGTSNEVIVAIEGTSPEYLNPANFNLQQNIYSTASLGADAVLAADAFTGKYTIPKCFADALEFVKSVIAAQKISASNVYVTGHSLGASEAQYVFANTPGLGGGVGFAGTGVPTYTAGMDTNTGFTNYLEYGDPVDNLASDSAAGSAFGVTNDNHVGLLNWRGSVSDQDVFTQDFTELKTLDKQIASAGAGTTAGRIFQDVKFVVQAKFVHDFVSGLHFHDLANYELGPPLPHAIQVDLTAQFAQLQNFSITTDASGSITESGTLPLGSSGNNETVQQTSSQDGSMRTAYSATINGANYSASNLQAYDGTTLSDAVVFDGADIGIGGAGEVGLAATDDGMPIVSVANTQSNLALDIAMQPSGGATPDIDIRAIDTSTDAANTVAAFSAADMSDQSLSVAVSANGTASVLSVINIGATVEAAAAAKVAGVTVGFGLSRASTLQVSDVSGFTATVDGLSVDNKLDLTNQTVSGVALSPGNSLDVTTASGQSAIQLDPVQNFKADCFDTSADGNGGTNIRLTSLVGIDTSGEIIKVDPANGMTIALSSSKIASFAAGGLAAVADKLYVAAAGDTLDTVDLQTGTVTGVASSATNFVADNATGLLVGASGGVGESLSSSGIEILAPTGIQTVDPGTGATHQLATLPGLLGIYVEGEAALDGKLYFSGQTAAGTQLYTMDVKTGTYSSVNTQATNFFADPSTGNLLGVANGAVYRVDPTTGGETAIASIAGLTGLSTSGEAAQGGYLYFDGIVAANGNSQEERFVVNEASGQYTASAGSTPNIVSNEPISPLCFAAGTLIATRSGAVAVEDLAVGDLVETVSGSFRPIRWLGKRWVPCRGSDLAAGALPIRIAAHAFGMYRPMRDLYLSPGHPVLVDADEDGNGGYLVPIMCLINGTTIARAKVDSVTYWHVELDAHDILLAEGLPAESYLDWGDRGFFSEAAQHALVNPDFIVPSLGGRCRPVTIDGPVVEAERRRLDCLFAERLAAPCAWPDASITAYL